MLELPRATLLSTAPAIMSYMAIKLTLSVIIPDLWDRIRPIIVEMERKIKRRPLKLLVGIEIEAAVEGLFAEESCG